MEYTDIDIDRIPLTEFMAALGYKPKGVGEGYALYYAPYRGDAVPVLAVDTRANLWHDYIAGESGGIRELALMVMPYPKTMNPMDYILNVMNNPGCVKSAVSRNAPHSPEDISKIRLTDFMAAAGLEPVFSKGYLRVYNAPYSRDNGPALVVNTETNRWHDVRTGNAGDIYELASKMAKKYRTDEISSYISGIMAEFHKRNTLKGKIPEQQKPESAKPKRKIRF
ncbi:MULTISPECIES: hypothetical protein [Bacteroidales]|jgi:hypothetical protein|uniref:hypothetical protein n=1 Tax=Bacteroidales TaxID=171549 RepID=UPI0025853BF8|nr:MULTISPECIES: hypothetical protein [Bacteroidales]